MTTPTETTGPRIDPHRAYLDAAWADFSPAALLTANAYILVLSGRAAASQACRERAIALASRALTFLEGIGGEEAEDLRRGLGDLIGAGEGAR